MIISTMASPDMAPEPATIPAIMGTLAAGLGAMIFGFALGFTGPTLTALETDRDDYMFKDARFQLVDDTSIVMSNRAALFASVLTIGAMAGSMSGGFL